MPIRIGTSEISSGFSKGEGKSPDGPRLPIGVGGGQVVLDSQLQNPLGLQGQDELVIRTFCRSHLFSSGCLHSLPISCLHQYIRADKRGVWVDHASSNAGPKSDRALLHVQSQ